MKRIIALIVVFTLTFSIMGCFPSMQSAMYYLQSKNLWNSNHINSYQVEYAITSQFENATAVITVTDNVITELGPRFRFSSYKPKTIEELFDEISMLMVSGGSMVEVTYDHQYGFPEKITANPEQILFREYKIYTIELTNFIPL